MIGRLRRKIHALRQEPEEVRLRVATYLTAISGGALALLWLLVLLPLQLHFAGPNQERDRPQAVATPTSGNVGGIRQEASPTAPPSQEFHGTRPSLRQAIPPATSPTPTPSPATVLLPTDPADTTPAP